MASIELGKASSLGRTYGALQFSTETQREREAVQASPRSLRMAIVAGSVFLSFSAVFVVALLAPEGALSSLGRTVQVSMPACTWCAGTPAAETSAMTAVAAAPAVFSWASVVAAKPKAKKVKKVRKPATKMIFHRSMKGPQQLEGTPDGTMLSEAVSVGPVGFAWIHRGGDVPTGWHCVHVYLEEIDLPDGVPSTQGWDDNFLCSTEDLHMAWSTTGPIAGQNCVQIYDDNMGGHAKNPSQYYLCLPLSVPYDFSFFQYGKLDMAHVQAKKNKKLEKLLDTMTAKQKLDEEMDPTCLIMTEHDDVYAWDTNNFLCITYAASVLHGGVSWGGEMTHEQHHMTAVTCAQLALKLSFTKDADWWELTTYSDFEESEKRLPGEMAGDCVIKVGPKEVRGGRAGKILGVTYYCGDGLVNTYMEDCDDGNTEAGDGCDENCKSEIGYYCTRRPQGVNHCEHIAHCDAPLPDRCACTLEEGFCDSLYTTGKYIVPQSSMIYDFYTCQSCCADAIHPCATAFATCPHEMKPAVQACNKKCVENFGSATCRETHRDREWWEKLPLTSQHVFGAKMDLLTLTHNQAKEAGVAVLSKFHDRVKMQFGANVVQ